jgi:hypothetical protein
MTGSELLRQVLQGVLLIVGEYRGSYAEMAGYVDKKSGSAIQYVRAHTWSNVRGTGILTE